jgi:hypothetical protein
MKLYTKCVHMTRQNRVILKIDFEKTYDKIN